MKKYFLIVIIFGAAACNQPEKNKTQKGMAKMPVKADTITTALKTLAFAVKKDLSCGMPISAGVSDTAYYKGRLYGFCSPECKADFLENAEQYLKTKSKQ